MLPMPAAEPFDSHEYAFEVAWHGIRALARIDRGQVQLWGRDLRDLTGRYPEVQALAAIAPPETIVDGELIVADGERRVPVPFVARFLREVDVARGRIVVDLPPGLLAACASKS